MVLKFFLSMSYQIGDLVIGTVENIKPYAIFLSFENGVKGLLHISEISDSYIKDIERFASLNDQMKVKILSIDDSNGFLRVSLKQVPKEERYSTHKNTRRQTIVQSDDDFKPLEERLNKWIKETLRKAEQDESSIEQQDK